MKSFSHTYLFSSPPFSKQNVPPFDELLLSWNGKRPKKGQIDFWLRVDLGEWVKMASWGQEGQGSFLKAQDLFQSSRYHHSFEIQLEPNLACHIDQVAVCTSNSALFSPKVKKDLPPIFLDRPIYRSQMEIEHERNKDLCSPTSLSIALEMLSEKETDPLLIAKKCHDQTSDIYGNWALNIAAGYEIAKIPCYVDRLPDFSHLHQHLQRQKPVVVSIKGDLKKAPQSYPSGHLCCVVGYKEGIVYCIDPAFKKANMSYVGYSLEDFIKAWAVKKNTSYVFL